VICITYFQIRAHKTAKQHASARIFVSNQAVPILKAYGEAMITASAEAVEVLNYAKKIVGGKDGAHNFARRSAVIFKDLSDKLFNFGAAGFGRRWSGIIAGNNQLKGLTHTRFRFYMESKVN
jgi:hypothetical protein